VTKLSVRFGLWQRLVALLVVPLLFLAACGGGDDDGDASPDTPGGTPTTEEEEEEQSDADPDGVVRMGYDLVSAAKGGFRWDPVTQATQLTDSGIFRMVYGGLLRPTSEGELVPDLAESTEVVDGNTIEITLRDGVTFSDGTPFDAEAVKAGLERTLAEGDPAGLADAFFDAETIEAVDEKTVRVIVPNGTAASWHDSYLGGWEAMIVKPGETNWDKPIGAGPMVIAEYVNEQRILLEKNPDYWDADSIRVAGVEFIHVPGGDTAGSSALQAGQVDMVGIPTDQIPALGSNHDVILEVDPQTLSTLMTCKREEPLSDPLVRKALNKALDREAISEAVFDGAYLPAHGLWPEGHRFHNPDVEDAVSFDPDGARALLEEAGYADGFAFDLYVIQGANMPEVAEVMQQMFADIGVRANLIPATNYVGDFLVANKAGAGLVPLMGANRQKLLQWTSEAVGNTCGYDDPELNEIIQDLGEVSDADDEAVDLWHQLEEKIVAEDTLSVFILFGARPVGYDTRRLGNATITPEAVPVVEIRETYVRAGS
jgi:ABC-type transport system substrate-binding protein